MEPKSFLASKTIWGVVITLLPQVIELGASGALGPKVQAGISVLGAIVAIWGRATAKQPISIAPPPALPLLPILFGVLGMMWIVGMITLQTGCTTTRKADRELIAQAAVVYATAKVIENNPAYAGRIAEIAGHVRQSASGDAVDTVAAVIALARAEIDWAKLSPADAALVAVLLDAVAAELTARLGEGVLPPDKMLVVAKVAGWIESTALLVMPPPAPQGLTLSAG